MFQHKMSHPTKFFHPVILFLCGFAAFSSNASAVPISNQLGKTIDVGILQIEPERIFIRMQDGRELWLERSRLSGESLQMIAELDAAPQTKYETINALLGITILQDNHLWDDTCESVAGRLDWALESRTENQSGYRHYPKEKYLVCGTRAYACSLYGLDGKAAWLSIVFANKGDFAFSPIPSRNEIKAMEKTIEQDEEQLVAHFSKALGEPSRQSFGGGGKLRERIYRWDWQDHSFLLASQRGEYVSLRIVDSATADNRGRGERLSDAELRKLTRQNVISSSNGDVIIKNIPMVNQGPKGYCVPATFERYLRYMQIPANMYLLAMAGQTGIGGGTYLSEIIDAVEGYLSSQNRSLKQMRTTIDISKVQKYIDDGLPVIWLLFSSAQYNNYANQRTKERQTVTNWNAWKEKLQLEERKFQLGKDIRTAHACLIIGYNKDTGEIAVSDSWGPEYAIRWISAKHAEQVSKGSVYLIGF